MNYEYDHSKIPNDTSFDSIRISIGFTSVKCFCGRIYRELLYIATVFRLSLPKLHKYLYVDASYCHLKCLCDWRHVRITQALPFDRSARRKKNCSSSLLSAYSHLKWCVASERPDSESDATSALSGDSSAWMQRETNELNTRDRAFASAQVNCSGEYALRHVCHFIY